jgi:hypothetical protein
MAGRSTLPSEHGTPFGRVRHGTFVVAIALLAAACGGAATSPSVTAPPAPSLAAAAAASVLGSFHLEKTCAGTECTVTKSTLSAIPAGTKISYSGPGMNALTATVVVDGGRATGTCNIANLPGTCDFTLGSGTLARFPSKVVVSQSGPTWSWDGDLRP